MEDKTSKHCCNEEKVSGTPSALWFAGRSLVEYLRMSGNPRSYAIVTPTSIDVCNLSEGVQFSQEWKDRMPGPPYSEPSGSEDKRTRLYLNPRDE